MDPIRSALTRLVIASSLLFAATALTAQPPTINHAQLTTQSAGKGLTATIDQLKQSPTPLWIGYTIPVLSGIHINYQDEPVAYLEGEHSDYHKGNAKEDSSPANATVLLRAASGTITKIKLENPERSLDAGGLRFVWLNDVPPAESVKLFATLAQQPEPHSLRDSAVFIVSAHRTPEALPALLQFASANSDLSLREKAAFWLANQHGHEGFLAIQRLAREDSDPSFREKLTFDLTLVKEPAALDEIVRIAHSDVSPRVRKQAQFWMATSGGKKVAGDLSQLASSDPNVELRKSAVFALSRLPGDEAATQLIQIATTSKDPAVRKQAIFWLGESSDPRALDYLTTLLKQ